MGSICLLFQLGYKRIEHLNLRLNNIGDEGISALANGLKRNRSLTRLNVSVNGITSYGLMSLADVVADHRQLQQLNLAGNFIEV